MIDSAGNNLVFLVGLPRSGTTLLAAMLGNHPAVLCPPEPWLMLAVHALGQVPLTHPAHPQLLAEAVRDFLPDPSPAARAFAVEAYNAKLREAGRSVFVDKTPRYYLILPYLAQLFPQAKFIWLKRNPLAVALSYRQSWGIDMAAVMRDRHRAELRGGYWEQAPHLRAHMEIPIGLARLWQFSQTHGDRVRTVTYESLVKAPDDEMRSLLTCLSMPQAEGLSELHLQDSPLAAAVVGDRNILQTTSPHTRSLDAWERKLSTQDLQTLLDAIGTQTMRRLGYADVVERCLALGIEDRGEDEAARVRWEAEALLTEALALQGATSHLTGPAPELFQAAARDGMLLNGAAERWLPEWHRVADKLDIQRQASSALQERLAALETELESTRQREQALTEALDTARRVGLDARLRIEQLEVDTARAVALAEARLRDAETHAATTTGALIEVRAERDAYFNWAQQLRGELSAIRSRAMTLEAERGYREEMGMVDRALDAMQGAVKATRGRLARRLNAARARRAARLARPDLPPAPPPLPSMTIVTPVFNGAAHLRECIESVLSQEYPNLQYIIIDGGSTDDTQEIVREYGDRIAHFISEPDQGMYDAIAKGFELATGDVLAYLNSDDLYEPGGLLRAGAYFRDHPRAKVVYHEDTVARGDWRLPNNGRGRADLIAILKGLILFQDGVFFRREAYWRAGGVNRSLRLAGDWDLWARMARYYKLHRAPGHVSCFRIREGQLSNNMDGYIAEIDRSRPAHQHGLRYLGYLRHYPRHWFNRSLNLLSRLKRRRMFYPLDASGITTGRAPASVAPPISWDQPRCPLTGEHPDRLLFSSRDTRFGDPMVNYVYHCSASDVAVVYPPLTREQLNVLYERHYSNPPRELILPAPGESSPYAGYFGGSRLDRLLLKLPLGKLLPPLQWQDRTIDELMETLRGRLPQRGGDVHFFDVGCFDGKLLDAIRERTDWTTSGLEANANAVQAARAKGHDVWHGYAEDALAAVPGDHCFDVVFMGQVIEHLLDPLLAVRRLTQLLKQNGLLVISTPNLRSRQLELFGPTWAHWHVPYHRAIHSPRSLRILAERTGLKLLGMRHYSSPYWTSLSVALNRLGLGGVVSHDVPFDADVTGPATRLVQLSRLLWDRRGRGDYMFAVYARQ